MLTNRTYAHFERFLIVCGNQNSGKSTLLRSMFIDPRIDPQQTPCTARRPPIVALSNERCLAFRIASPHERGLTLEEFMESIYKTACNAWNRYWRVNFACAMQPFSANNMPSITTVCKELNRVFQPERIRVVQIDPTQDGSSGSLLSLSAVSSLIQMNVEVTTIDARRHSNLRSNAFFLADFFDFT